MNLAILGTDPDMLALVEAAIGAGHRIVWLSEVRAEDRFELERFLPGFKQSADWESLLDHTLADAVLVGRGTAAEELRAEQLKRLVADAVTLLVIHPVCASVLPYYEVDMARRESHAVLRHYTPLTGSPTVAELASWVATGASEIGVVHQVICQRTAADCGRKPVLRHLARDVEVLRAVAGGVRTVSAVGPSAADASYASLQVQMTGPGSATIRWSIAPASDSSPRAGLTLIGERGIARIRLPAEEQSPATRESDGDWQLDTSVGGENEIRPATSWNAPRAAIDELEAVLAASGTAKSEAASTWQAATAAMEIVDTIELSLQKGRTIEVHPQRLTEQSAFRGMMAAIGCGLLMLGLFVLVAAGLLGDVVGLPLRNHWPVALLAVLAAFLLIQALPLLVTRKRPAPNGGEQRSEPDWRRRS